MTTKAVLRSIKNVTNGYSSVQVLVRDATSNAPESPSVRALMDICSKCQGSIQDTHDTLAVIDKRLNDKGKNWRHVAKALTVLNYLVCNGPESIVFWAQDNLYIIKTLREFQATDSQGNDQGSIVRVKAKELTSLLLDSERLAQERLAAGSNKKNRRRNRRHDDDFDADAADDDLQRALEASRMTAEEEERLRRENGSNGSLDRAIQLSLEEEQLRQQKMNQGAQIPDVYGVYAQQQPAQMLIGYDMMGNPVYGTEADLLALQQQHQLQMQMQMQQMAQQQQMLYQQQMALAQQAQMQQMQHPGSNNPFSNKDQDEQDRLAQEELERKQRELQQQQLALQQQQQQLLEQERLAAAAAKAQEKPMKQTLTGSQKMNEQYSDLNNLLAQGTGIDTFGNTGDARIPAQFTQSNFVNSYGISNGNNPFQQQQASRVWPAETGYGFGNQQRSQQQQQPGSLIDL